MLNYRLNAKHEVLLSCNCCRGLHDQVTKATLIITDMRFEVVIDDVQVLLDVNWKM